MKKHAVSSNNSSLFPMEFITKVGLMGGYSNSPEYIYLIYDQLD